MKSLINIRALSFALLLCSGFSLLLAGCAPPPAGTDLQRKIDELLQVQQAQAAELAALKEQLASRDTNMVPPVGKSAEPTPVETAPPTSTETAISLPAVAAEDIAEMSRSASLYLASFAAIATGRMADAEAGFRDFITRYPDHEYVGNAKYWLAEALFALQRPRHAETLLLDIIDNPQQENKAPAAMARLVRYYRESGADNNANAMLELLNSRYPESPEIQRLQQGKEPR